ncbi:DUF7848 domain-containing protein [Streptomyces sp. 8N616]|uniref:DUF7848 domain-containing protein n=1 Tax=Streptomyces sp. 8N616 TaxID=3457414 RepID=UPI003FD1A895
MTPRAVWRYADWVLTADTSGSGPIYVAECTTCGDASEASEETEGPEVWSLKHAGRTGHTGFRNIITSFSRASLAEGRR